VLAFLGADVGPSLDSRCWNGLDCWYCNDLGFIRSEPCLLASPLTHRRHPDDFAGGDSSGATLHILQPAPLRRRCLDLAFRRPTHRSHHRNPLTSPSKAKIRPHQANRFSNHAREPCTKSDVSSRWRGLGWRSRRRVGAGLTPRRCPKIERAQ